MLEEVDGGSISTGNSTDGGCNSRTAIRDDCTVAVVVLLKLFYSIWFGVRVYINFVVTSGYL